MAERDRRCPTDESTVSLCERIRQGDASAREEGDQIAIGAMTRHMDVETSALLKEHVPLLAHAASHVGDPQVRHRGTPGSSSVSTVSIIAIELEPLP